MRCTRILYHPLAGYIASGAMVKQATIRSTNALARRSCLPNQFATQGVGALSLRDHVYVAKATASGLGRHGTVESNDDLPMRLQMDIPRAAGGKGEGQNPEQLFAMSYSSCFLGALQLAAARAEDKELAEDAQVNASVYLGHPEDPNKDGFGLRVELTIEGCDDDAIINAARELCPYSRALLQGAEVKVLKA